MTNVNRMIDQAARRAETLPMARIVALMLGGSAAFYCLAMPPRVLRGLFESLGLPGPGPIGHILFAALFALLAAAIGWLALTIIARAAVPVPAEPEQPNVRKRPVSAAPRAQAPVAYRRGDAHPDAPPRRPIFAAHDLGTPFDEIVTDRAAAPAGAEEARPEPEPIIEPPLVDSVAVEETPVVEQRAEPPVAEEAAELPVVEEVAEAPLAAVPEPAGPPEPPELVEEPAPVTAESEPEPEPEPAPPAGRDESIAALMARFEGGLDRLGGSSLPPPPDPSAVSPLKRAARSPDDALRDALEALQRMAARQR